MRLLIIFSLFFLYSCGNHNCDKLPLQLVNRLSQVRTNNTTSFPHKLWLHRTNTINKFKDNAAKYPGFELDVNIDSKELFLDVYHPPQKSSHINFEDYLRLPESEGKYFWLDCKNLDTVNVQLAISVLDSLNKRYSIKDRLIFESMEADALEKVSKAGYKVTWYLPIPVIKNGCMDTTYIKQIASRIHPDFSGISADGKYIRELNRLFPNCKKFTWALSVTRNFFEDEKKIMLADTNVVIVLEKKW